MNPLNEADLSLIPIAQRIYASIRSIEGPAAGILLWRAGR
jgi:hypothetical protein